MKSEKRTIVYDRTLNVEAYRFEGMVRDFPAHFHEHYTIGYMNEGARRLICPRGEYTLCRGDMVVFNPHDTHACCDSGGAMDFSGINIAAEIMTGLAEKITGRRVPPKFSENVISDHEAAERFVRLHECLCGENGSDGEEKLLRLASVLIENYAEPFGNRVPEYGAEVARVCGYIGENYHSRITLEQLCRCACASKSTLLRAFTSEMGITPHGYLENIRICEARKLLESGCAPNEAAAATGFYDQSHFTTYFTRFVGVPPKEYQARIRGEK